MSPPFHHQGVLLRSSSAPPTHDILIMPRKLPGRTGTRSCAEQGIRSLGQTAGVLLRQPLASSLTIDMGVSYYALSDRNGSLHLLLSVYLFGIIAALCRACGDQGVELRRTLVRVGTRSRARWSSMVGISSSKGTVCSRHDTRARLDCHRYAC